MLFMNLNVLIFQVKVITYKSEGGFKICWEKYIQEY